MNKSNKLLRKSFSLFVGTGLVAGNLFQLALPAFAGQLSITNQATGTYDDGNSANQSTTLSNTVTITVEEVPAISINNGSISKADASGNAVAGQLQPGDKLVSVFDVVNGGNDPTKIFIPGPTELNGNSAVTNGTATKVIYQVKDSTGANIGTAVELTGAGQVSANSVPVGGKIEVKVLVNVSTTANPGDNVEVKLGNTADAPNNQNQDRSTDIDTNDVYTEDNADGSVAGEYPGVTTNVREASNKQSLAINAIPKPFVKIEKTYGTYSENSPVGPENDVLQYNLQVTVPQTKPTGVSAQLTTDNLYPTFVNGLSGIGQTGQLHVLISDVLPDNTKLTGVPTAPTNWTVVYSTDTATTPAYKATWTTTAPTDLNTVTRVGYIYTGGQSVAKSDTAITGFSYNIKLTNAITAGSSILNLAEIFGEEAGKTPTNSTDPSVYDQSGDQTYNNDSDNNGTPDTPVQNTNGKPDPTNDPGNDTGNNNSGTGNNGEPNAFTVPTRGVLNGTVINSVNYPDAAGPGGDKNLDFTNASASITATTIGDVTITNSLKNTSDVAKDLKVVLVASDLTDLPVGTTIITITDPNNTTQTVTYQAVQTTVGGTPTLTITSTQTTPVTFTAVPKDGVVTYTVTISLPDNATQNTGYDVPVTAFIDTNGDNALDAGDSQNKTIDRVYAGFVTLVKKSQVLDNTGTPVSGANGLLDTSAKTATNGQRIKFVIEYLNISEAAPSGGSNNGLLDAKNLKITEDGATATNNWANPTSHITGTTSASASTKFTVNFFNGASSAVDSDAVITKYESVLNAGQSITPQESGTFTFQRLIK